MVRAVMDRVFIRLEQEKTTKGGVILADNVDNPRTVGIIESVGEDVKSVKVGEKVLFHVFDELPTYDKDVVVVRENSILGVFEDE